MNIFVVDLDPNEAARQLCDKHVFKMHTESVQLLVSLANNLGIKHHTLKKNGTLHQGGYPHHPCCKWLEESINNVDWLLHHAYELCYEHQRRSWLRGEDVLPFSYSQLNSWVGIALPWVQQIVPNVLRTPFPQCMPEQYRCDNAVEAYRAYYIGDKSSIAEWKHLSPPAWYKQGVSCS